MAARVELALAALGGLGIMVGIQVTGLVNSYGTAFPVQVRPCEPAVDSEGSAPGLKLQGHERKIKGSFSAK